MTGILMVPPFPLSPFTYYDLRHTTYDRFFSSRATEGASYGNLVDAVKAPGKKASGLWWSWDAPQQQLRVMLTILYRRADMGEVECYQG